MGTGRGGEFAGVGLVYEGNPPGWMNKEKEMNGLSVLDETPRRADQDQVVIRTDLTTAELMEIEKGEAEMEDRGLDVDRLLAIEREAEEAKIKFKARVWKVGSLGGGGLRVVLNLDQKYIRQMAMLAECQHDPEMELEFEARQSKD